MKEMKPQPGQSVLTDVSVRSTRFSKISVCKNWKPIGCSENQEPMSLVSVFLFGFLVSTEQTDGR
jgi:hypothetical protein